MAPLTFLVGSFHDRAQLLHLDAKARSMTLVTLPEPVFANYTWVTRSPKHHGIFYASRTALGQDSGTVSVVRLQADSKAPAGYRLDFLQHATSGGIDPCHCTVSPSGHELAIANYASSTVLIYEIAADGLLGKSHGFDGVDEATGPNADRQDASHPHGCFFLPAPGDWLVPDLGCDKLRIIGKENQTALSCHPGAGPRHAALHSNGRYVYAINELNNTVSVHDLTAPEELPKVVLSAIPSDASSAASEYMNAAAIALSSDNSFVYVTNRLESHDQGDAIVWFSVSEDGSQLRREGELRTGLDHPRCAELFMHENRHYLIVGSKTQRGAVVYERDSQTGALSEVARNDEIVHPSAFALV